MDDHRTQEAQAAREARTAQAARTATKPAAARAGAESAGQPGVIGIALGAVLAASLAQGSWQWFATYIGVTLLAVMLAFYRLPAWTPGLRSGYGRNLVAFSLVAGLCVAITLAPMLQRWAWLFPMPGTRDSCGALGTYESLHTRAALADLAPRAGTALAQAQEVQSHTAVADCLSATTTLWLPVYACGAALVVGLCAWFSGRARTGSAAVAQGAGAPRV